MSDDVNFKVTIDDDEITRFVDDAEKEFSKLGKSAGDSIGDAFDIKSLADVAAGFYLVKESIGAVISAAKALGNEFLQLQLRGEDARRIGQSFELLASQAGLSGKAIKDDLISAIGGIAETDTVLASANKALVSLGENANKLPETFELARKATLVFGGDAVGNFELINQAISSLNTRSLRQIGIVVDAEATYKQYAASLGTTADKLTIVQKQQALLSATLEAGNNSLKSISLNQDTLRTSSEKLTTSAHNLTSAISEITFEVFGESTKNLLEQLADANNKAALSIKELGGGSLSTEEQLAKLNIQLRENERSLQNVGAAARLGTLPALEEENQAIRRQISELQNLIDKRNESNFQRSLKSSVNVTDAGGFVPPVEAVDKALQDLQIKLATARAQYLQENAQFLTDADIQNGVFTEQITGKSAADLEKLLNQLKTFKSEYAKTLEEANKLTQRVLANGISNAIQQTISAIARGESAFKAFGNAILQTFGDLAIQLGNFYIAKGLADYALISANPGAEIATGAALVALGSIIKSFFGSQGASASVPVTAGGTAGPTLTNDVTTGTAEAVQEKTTKVQIDVAGTVLDPISVGRQISEILNETFNATGTRVVTA